MGRSNFRVVSVEQHSLNLTDNTSWQGELNIVRCTRHGVEGAEVGDQVSAEINPLNPNVVSDPFIERGRSAAALKPAPFVAPQVAPYDPNAVGNYQIFRGERGQPLSPDDVDTMLREQAKTIAALVADVKFLKCFTREHCGHCQAILSAKGAFDK